MNATIEKTRNALSNIKSEHLAWLWLVVGALLLPFTAWQTVIALASWLAPVFLLRFTRTSRYAWVALPLVFIAYVAAGTFGGRDMPWSTLGFIGNVIFKPLIWTVPYLVDRALANRLAGWLRSLVFPLTFALADWALCNP